MNSTIMHKQMNRFQVLNLLTNILTVLFFIIYSISKRFEPNTLLFTILSILFGINAIISIYLLLQRDRFKPQLPKYINVWIVIRIVANISLGVLSFTTSNL